MVRTNKEFSDEQWRFLKVLYALGGPVPIQVAGVLVPLLPGPLFELIDQGRAAGWLHQDGNNRFSLTKEVPEKIRQALAKRATQQSLSNLAQDIYSKKLNEKLDPKEMLALLKKAGRMREAGEHEIRLAHTAFENNDYETARVYLQSATEHLNPICFEQGVDSLFLTAVLEFSNILFSLGYGFGDIEKFLVKANEVSKKMGNQRVHALVNLHLGRLFYFSNRRDEAITALSMGFEKIGEIGDNDILGQSAMFLGLFYYIKGLHREAIEQFEKAEKIFETARYGELTNPIAPFLTGYCAVYLGQFHRAIGNLDYQWRLALDRSNIAMASTIRATLGTALVFMRKKKEGLLYLQQVIEEADECKNQLGLYLGRGGLSLYYFLEGRLDEAYQILRINKEEGREAGIIRQYSSPWVLDTRYQYLRLGFEQLPEVDIHDEIEHVINGINVHLQGVALRIRASEKATASENLHAIKSDLDKSMQCLEQSGDPIELSKTILEKVRLELKIGNRQEARQLAEKARHLLEGYNEEFFPDEFRHLIEKPEIPPNTDARDRKYLQRYLKMIESLYSMESRHEILTKVLTNMNRMFGAERSALFWFASEGDSEEPELRATCNLSPSEVQSGAFKRSMDMVVKAFQTNQPQLGRLSENENPLNNSKVRSNLCIPVEVRGSVKGVMYFDNSYLPDAFDFLDPEIMRDIVRHTNLVIERRFNYLQTEQERNILDSIKSLADRDKNAIIAKSKKMTLILTLSDQVAKTESSVLILGETGTGKELLARWIHKQSNRSEKPFIIVDATTIPESLLESELFGHERGSFTGADKRKIGRIEMADKGTLFLDEVGELPLSAQVKLLRALQEKEFYRVGGTRTIHSDFRLITATNRELEKEVAKGRFREDLFYRLNVIPIRLPPLRERIEDIPLLASYFMEYYANNYKRQDLKLTAEQEMILCRYSWPGNVRELKNVIERAFLLSSENTLEFNLPEGIQKPLHHPFEDNPTLEDVQCRYIEYVISKTGGKIGGAGGAAEILGMKRTSVYSRMKQLKIDVPSIKRKAYSPG